jgi:Methyltransferase domain
MFARAACNLLRRDAIRRLFNNRIVIVDYPVEPRRKGQNTHVTALVNRQLGAIRASIAGMTDAVPLAETIAPEFWDNEWFPPVDAIALMSFIARQKPQTYFEVGSGYSTTAARHAIDELGLGTRIVSVDPKPRADVDALCDTMIRVPFEQVKPAEYSVVKSGDVVFIDNSHHCFQGSDVETVFLDLLPSLPPGVFVGIHDIFLPFDYPEVWRRRFYNEQYALAAYLLGLGDRARIELPGFLITNDDSYANDLATVRTFIDGKKARFQGCAFWFTSPGS